MNNEYKVVSQLDDGINAEEDKRIVDNIRKYGKVPVIHGPTRSMVRPPSKLSLTDNIHISQSPAEISAMVTKAVNEYKNVSAKTIKRWNKAAAARIAELTK